MTFKTPIAQANAMEQPFDKAKTLKWLENYGDFVTDDAYVDWAKKNNVTVGKPTEPRGYYNEYIQNEDFLKHLWDQKNKYGEEW